MRSVVLFSSLAMSVLFAQGCTTDEKGLNCGFLDVYTTADGESYCPDPDAESDCELVREAMVEHFTGCGLTEEDATEITEGAIDCSVAVATSTSMDDCLEVLDSIAPEDCTASLPDPCKGVVLTR